MRITLEIPDELAASLSPCQDPARMVLEAVALEAYRERRVTGYQLRILLGIPSRQELDSFLKVHRVEKYTAEDFDRDLDVIAGVEAERRA
jgi:hypothetical protein